VGVESWGVNSRPGDHVRIRGEVDKRERPRVANALHEPIIRLKTSLPVLSQGGPAESSSKTTTGMSLSFIRASIDASRNAGLIVLPRGEAG
jgi:hypothetical protein